MLAAKRGTRSLHRILLATALAALGCNAASCATAPQKTTTPVAADRDGDKILDHCDACPDQAENYNQTEDADGCPEQITVRSSRHGLTEQIYFAEHAAAPLPTQQAALDAMIKTLRRGETTKLACVGAFLPGERGGIELARRRAEAVCALLAAGGIARERLVSYASPTLGAALLAARPTRRELARRVELSSIELAPQQWYQRPLTILRWDGQSLRPSHDRPLLAPSGPARCPAARWRKRSPRRR